MNSINLKNKIKQQILRAEEFNEVKEVIRNYFNRANCGIFNTRNVVFDRMSNVFKGKYFKVDICFNYAYFEVFGTNEKEFDQLKKYYEKIRKEHYE